MLPLQRGQETDLIEIPASWYLDDLPPMLFIKKSPNSHGFVNPRDIEQMWIDQFDWVHREFDHAVFTMTIHPDVSGRPQVLLAHERIIEHINAHEGVRWVPLRDPPPQTCDLYIACQHPRLFGFVPKPKRLVVWVVWQPNHLKHYKNILKVWWHRPIPVLISRYQVGIYSPFLPRRNPHIVVPHGLAGDIRGLPPLTNPPPPEAIFASNPTRNLKPLVQIFADRILPRRPDALFHIYGIHDLKPGDDPWRVWSGSFLPTGLSETARAAIRIHPTASRAELMAAVRRSRIMLYLGHKVEAFCFALAEAQAMGVPCVVAPVAALPERVIDGVTGYVRANPQDFADAALALAVALATSRAPTTAPTTVPRLSPNGPYFGR
jgi:glycosyltransferase involved in cell wall biosynthesis